MVFEILGKNKVFLNFAFWIIRRYTNKKPTDLCPILENIKQYYIFSYYDRKIFQILKIYANIIF